MIAVDTNVLARFYVDDPADPEAARQRPAARRVLAAPSVFVPMSVVLELEWVLRALYRFSPSDFGRVLEHLFGLANVTVENWTLAAQALEAHLQGMDFADALHLACSTHCSAFVTFDRRRFASKAARLGLQPEVVLPGPR
ncbi:MAG: type II toxin-antitoxin system VapC family toxin [Burkholderiales bacterium]|nr:type II toxin-antitoxin system VapC family toxin [Burkholderiales bacterium]